MELLSELDDILRLNGDFIVGLQPMDDVWLRDDGTIAIINALVRSIDDRASGSSGAALDR